MSRHEIYEQRAEELLEPILADMNFELVDVEYVKEEIGRASCRERV